MQFKGTGSLFVKDIDQRQGIVQAYWNAFGNIDDQRDIVDYGCWTKSIRERGPKSSQPRIKMLYQHDDKLVVARPSEIVEDSFGLLATCQIPPTTLGKDILILYEYQVLTEHSVGYETVLTQWDTKVSARHLKECVLWEGSPVTWAANMETPVVALKALTQPARLTEMADRAQRIDNLLHNGSLRSDALCEKLERELKSLHTALAPTQDTADATPQPYTIQGVLDSMTNLAGRLGHKATDDDIPSATNIAAETKAVEVADDGTHANFTGTHTHSHKAMGAQGDDDMHSHKHTHDGDSKHSHKHSEKPSEMSARHQQPYRKARDFDTLFASLNESDQLQDDWGDTFIACVQAMQELMYQSQYQQSGYLPESMEVVDIESAAKANLDAFSAAVMGLVTRSVAADFVPAVTCDRDQFIDPDGPNAESNDYDDWKGHDPRQMPAAPTLLGKAGRAIGSANRKVITEALDGMSVAMKALQGHHGAIADLMTKTDPDAVRQDEDDTQGDDDTENGGHNVNKGRHTDPAPDRRTSQAGTTHQQGTANLDLSAFDADFDAITSRLKRGGKAE